MASRIAGITIEIGGDTTNLQKSLKGLDSQLKSTQNNLKDIDKLLKIKPGNVELLTQKQKNLTEAIGLTKNRLEELKTAQSGVEKGSAEWDALQREIIATEGDLKTLQKQYKEFGSVASQQIKAVADKVGSMGDALGKAGQALKPVSAAAGAVGGALLKLGYDAVTNADELNTLSKQTGISTDELQKMQYAADLVDVSVEDITGALRKMKTKLDPANETFAALGVSVTDADGNLRDATDVFYDSIEALSQISNETERDQVAMELFGKSADSLAGIIDDGGAALRAYGQEAEELGVIVDGDTLNALNETNDTLDRLKGNIKGSLGQLGATVAGVLAPALEKVAGVIGKVTEKIRKMNPETAETILKIVGVVAAIAPLLLVGQKLFGGIQSIISVVGTLVGVLGGPLTLAIGAVIAAGILLYKNWDTVKAFAIRLKDGVVNAFNTMKSRIDTIIANIRSKLDTLKAKFEEIKQKAQDVVQKIKDFFNFRIQLPHINLPHIQISYEPADGVLARFLGINSIPRLSVAWYKKAYDNPVMFTRPTVLQTPTGLKGFGDGSGAEIVMGLDKLREVVGGAAGVTINVYAQPGMDVSRLADEIQDRFVAMAKQRRLYNGA